ncbi:MAG TPA: hypothetical protein VKX41_07875 [Alloacidobacterium sp.]|nr:hypothetical protein [Alloacidobacterium sp.]
MSSLQAWGDLAVGVNMLPWPQNTNLDRFHRMLDYFSLNGQLAHRGRARQTNILRRLIPQIIDKPVQWRIRESLYAFPWELWLSQFSERIVKRRSLITGKELPTEAGHVC